MRFRKTIFILGILLFLYPTISDWWNSYHQSQVISRYVKKSEQMDDGKCKGLLQKAAEYNCKLRKNGFLTPLSEKEKQEYAGILDMYPDGLMGYIHIPAIDCRLPIYHGTEEAVLQIGVGHVEGTSFPVGGKDSHCILSGHRGLPSSRLFTGLDQLKIGDVFQICILNKEIVYEICEIQTVLPEETDLLKIEKGKELCTLVTCTPYGINTHRLLLTGQQREKEENRDEQSVIEESGKGGMSMRVKCLTKWSVVLMLIILFWFGSNQKMEAAGIEEQSLFKNANISEKLTGSKEYQIIIQYPFAEIEFKLYRILGENHEKEINLTKVDYGDKTYILETSSVQIQKTDEKGYAIFRGIETGRYLVVGTVHENEGCRYRPVPAEIDLSNLAGWVKTVVIKPKYEQDQEEEEGTEESKTDKTEETTEENEQEDEKKPEPTLPQTGQLWIPVILFLISGFCFVIMGWRK